MYYYNENVNNARMWSADGEKKFGHPDFPTARQFIGWIKGLCAIIDDWEYVKEQGIHCTCDPKSRKELGWEEFPDE